MLPGDLGEAWLLQLAEAASGEDLTFDTRYIDAYPNVCPVCGQDPRRWRPYSGVSLQTYRDLAGRRVVPFWACAPCARRMASADPDLLALRVRLRLQEFVTED